MRKHEPERLIGYPDLMKRVIVPKEYVAEIVEAQEAPDDEEEHEK